MADLSPRSALVVPTPATAGGAANRGYVDAAIAGLRPVLHPPVVLTYAASLTPVASDGNYRVCTLTGAATLNPPTSPADGQLWRVRFIASAAERVVTLNAALRRPAAIPATLTIAAGRRGDVGLLYEAADGAWAVLAAQTA